MEEKRKFVLFWKKGICLGGFIFCTLFLWPSFAAESLSYSGRLVNADGSPVTGLVNLQADLAYTNDPTVILCTQAFTDVALTNGVFHLKLNLACSSDTLEEVLQNIPANESVAIRITDQTHAKAYSFQALHSMPLATMASTAKNLVQMNALEGQVLTWDNGAWKPLAPATLAAGSVGTTELADGSVTDPKVATGISRAKLAAGNPGYVLVNDGNGLISETPQLSLLQGGTGASTAAGAWTNLGIVIGTAAGQFMGADAVPSCAADEKLFMTLGPTYLWDCIPDGDATKLPLAGGQMSGTIDMFTHRIIDLGSPVNPGDAANKAYVDAEVSGVNASQWTTNGSHIHFDTGNVGLGTSIPTQKLDVVGNISLSGKAMLQSDTANYVELKAPLSLASTLTFSLPGSYGTSGYALITDGAGNLSWSAVATTSTSVGGDLSGSISNAQIVAGAIVDADVSATAGIAQSKIAGLTTDLAAKEAAIASGTTDQYWRGDKSWQDLKTDVRGTDLAGLSSIAGTVTATDTVLTSIGKLTGNQNNYVLKAGDTMSGPLALGANKITGLADPTAASDAATKAYVDTEISGINASQWTTAGSNIHFDTGNVGLGTSTPAQKLDVIGNIALTGKVQLKSDTANYVELKAPLSLAASLTFNLPSNYGTSGQALTTDGLGIMSWTDVATTATAVGGDLSGTIANAQIASGAVGSAEIADGSIVDADVATTAAIAQSKIANLTTDLAAKEPTIAAGLIAQYWRGDKTWQTLDTSVVPEGSNLYFLDSRVRAAIMSGYAVGSAVPLAATDTLLEALGKLEAQIIANDAAFDATGQWSKNGSDIYFNTGNVGIGIQAPTSKFSVFNSINNAAVSVNTDVSGLDIYNSDNNIGSYALMRLMSYGIGDLASADGNYLMSRANGNNDIDMFIGKFTSAGGDQNLLTLKSNGSVGIGTITPGTDFSSAKTVHIKSSGRSSLVIEGSDASYATLVLASGPQDSTDEWHINTFGAAGDKILNFWNGGNKMSLLQNGNVGIGTENPTSKFQVNNTFGVFKTKYIGNQGSSYRRSVILLHAIYDGVLLDNNYMVGTIFGSRGSVGSYNRKEIARISTGSAYNGTTGMVETLSSDGGRWQLVTAYFEGIKYMAVEVPYVAAELGGLVFEGFGYSSAPRELYLINYYDTQNATVLNAEVNSSKVNFTAYDSHFVDTSKSIFSGSVGIGITSPSEKLHVSGNILASGSITPSDRRLKKDIVPVENALQKVISLNGVTYDWIDTEKHTDKRQLGVIAQDVQKAFPEAVITTNDGFLAVSYQVLVSPLIEAVKELYEKHIALGKRVDHLEEKEHMRGLASLEFQQKMERDMAEMKSENEELKSQNAMMKDYFCQKDPEAHFCRR